jgi:branched-chain amino acid transport system substrate-binding protein
MRFPCVVRGNTSSSITIVPNEHLPSRFAEIRSNAFASRSTWISACAVIVAFVSLISDARSAEVSIPIVMPITGFLSVEGGAQRNGAVMALERAPSGLKVHYDIYDTGTSATGAAAALDKALSARKSIAVAASIFGTEMVAMMPIAAEFKVPLITISGLSRITESDNRYIFRFLPNDREIKVAHARYVVEKLQKTKIALIGDLTAYGQGGFRLLQEYFGKLGVKPVLEDSVAPDAKDMSPVLRKIRDSGADVIVMHAVAQPMALMVKQARASGIDIAIVTGSSLVEPHVTALFEPKELANICAETPSVPEARATPDMRVWADAYKARFGLEPDGLALGQYDAMMMTLSLVAAGADTPAKLMAGFHDTTYKGIAMTYKSNGKGDMAHDAEIVCWNGTSRIPSTAARYAGEELRLK